MAALMAPTVTWEDYRRYLEWMAQVYGTLEPPLLASLDGALIAQPDLRPAVRPKLPALLRDLAALGIPAPRIAARPDPGGLSETLGGLYVLEGATLGSRVIARHLRRHLQGAAGDPLGSAAFIGLHDDAQGPSVSLAWRQFGDSLDALAERDLIARDRVVAGARAAFAWVYRILAGPPSPP
jgi:heme oxygenase